MDKINNILFIGTNITKSYGSLNTSKQILSKNNSIIELTTIEVNSDSNDFKMLVLKISFISKTTNIILIKIP